MRGNFRNVDIVLKNIRVLLNSYIIFTSKISLIWITFALINNIKHL